jgi:putative PIN family toxin of toxin-antitoxin system
VHHGQHNVHWTSWGDVLRTKQRRNEPFSEPAHFLGILSMLRAVLDTNVVVAGSRSALGASFEILQALRRGEWRCILSNHLLMEYQEKLLEMADFLGATAGDVDGVLTVICAHAEEWQLRPDWHPALHDDPDDEPLVQLAHESRANLVVTHNVRHLLPAESLGIKVLRPRDFLLKLRGER